MTSRRTFQAAGAASVACRTAWVALTALTVACRLETLETLASDEPPPPSLAAAPLIPAEDPTAQPTVGWESIVRQHLAFLAGPLPAGRRPGTDGALLSQRLAIATFSEAGLTPDGVDRTWSQPVPIEVASHHRVKMATALDLETEGGQSQITLDTGIYVRRDGESAPYQAELKVAVVPDALLAPEAVLPVDLVAGKLAIARLVEPEDGDANHTLREAQRIFGLMRGHGASACLLALPIGSARPIIVEHWTAPEVRLRVVGSAGAEASFAFHGFIDAAVLDVLEAAAQAHANVSVTIESQTRSLGDANVLGRIPGSEDPGHVVVVLAHWDAGGLTPPLPKGGAAIQNGSGIAALFAMAEVSGRWFALGRRPARSIVFAATAAGSLGHLGAPKILELPGMEPQHIVAVLNLEDLDWRGEVLEAIDGDRSSLGHRLLELDGRVRLAMSDVALGHTSFLQVGLPALTLRRPLAPDPLGPPDEWGSLETLARDAELAFRLAWELADRAAAPQLIVAPPPP